MAQRFGGRHSPGGATPEERAVREQAMAELRVDAAGAKANLMFVPPAILVFTALGEPLGLVAGLGGAAVLFLAAWLLRDGLRAAAAYEARPVARRPALPRKMLASLLTGVGIALAAWTPGAGLLGPVLYGIAALGLHVAAFGIDPLVDKRPEGIDPHQQDRVARVVDEAEAYLTEMKERIALLRDRKLELRVAGFQAQARRMIRTVEEDPRDLTGARKYLGVYLMGARDAARKFAEHYGRTADAEARDQFEALLTDLEQNFAARTEAMIEGDRSDMDIEIKVLRDRLHRDGVTTE